MTSLVATRKIYYVDTFFAHHGEHSGYHMLTRYLPGQFVSRQWTRMVTKYLHWRLWAQIHKRAGLSWYKKEHFEAELAVLLSHIRDGIVHILYGENNYGHLERWWWRGRARLVCTFHQPPEKFTRQVVEPHRRLKKVDGIIALSRHQGEFIQRFVSAERVHIVPHGVDTDFFYPRRERDDNAQDAASPICLFVGHWLRDFDTLERVVQGLRAEMDKVQMVAITPPLGCERLVRIPGLTVYSNVSDESLRTWYQEAAVFVLPLEDCVANNALLEAMACGVPIVASNVGGIEDYVDSRCAILVPKGDAGAMVDGIVQLVRDEKYRRALGEVARERVVSQFDWRLVAERTRRVYQAIAA